MLLVKKSTLPSLKTKQANGSFNKCIVHDFDDIMMDNELLTALVSISVPVELASGAPPQLYPLLLQSVLAWAMSFLNLVRAWSSSITELFKLVRDVSTAVRFPSTLSIAEID